MSPTERIAAIEARCHKAHRKPDSDRRNLAIARVARAAKRLARLETERTQWEHDVWHFDGNVKAIAEHMGVDYQAAKRALHDLGLWPAVEEARLGA